MKVVVYQKPSCSTCKELAVQLKAMNIDYEKVDYYIDPVSESKLRELLRKMNVPARDIVRTKAEEYLELGLDGPDVTDDELIAAMAKYPELLQRPIVEAWDRAVLARPAERVRELLGRK